MPIKEIIVNPYILMLSNSCLILHLTLYKKQEREQEKILVERLDDDDDDTISRERHIIGNC